MSEGEAHLAELPCRLEVAPKVGALVLPSSSLLPDNLQPRGQERYLAQDALSKKTERWDLPFGKTCQLHRKQEGSSSYEERQKRRDLLQKSIQLIWKGTDLPRDAVTETRTDASENTF